MWSRCFFTMHILLLALPTLSLASSDIDLVETSAFEETWHRDVEESVRQGNLKPFVEEAILQVSDWGFALTDLQVQRKCARSAFIPWLQFLYGQPECELTGYLGPIHIWQDECVYTLYVETGTVIKAGTNSQISITLGDSNNKSVSIPNLKEWGLMSRKHDYFERANLDLFSGRGPCIAQPICKINVTSDGSGSHHGWYCNNIQVTSSGPNMGCSQSIFYVDQWLASDAPPYELSVVIDACGLLAQSENELLAQSVNGRFTVRKPVGSERQSRRLLSAHMI